MFAIRFLSILTSAYMTFAHQTLADCDLCRSGHMPIAKKSIQTRQMPIDTNAYQTFADQTFANQTITFQLFFANTRNMAYNKAQCRPYRTTGVWNYLKMMPCSLL